VNGYRRDSPQAYCLGSFAVLELLRYRPGQARLAVVSSRLSPERRAPLARLCARHGVPLNVDDDLLRRLGHRKDIDALALFEKYAERLEEGTDHLVLVKPGNAGNLGTALRTMAAFGVRDLALVGGADPFNPHVLRASLGARFQVRVESFADLDEYRRWRRRPLHLFTGHGGLSLSEVSLASPFTLVFGPEWPGLSPQDVAAGTSVRIPHHPSVESLNLGVAVGVALYAARIPDARSGGQ
jgi:TrmH family RNA methyltransferase